MEKNYPKPFLLSSTTSLASSDDLSSSSMMAGSCSRGADMSYLNNNNVPYRSLESYSGMHVPRSQQEAHKDYVNYLNSGSFGVPGNEVKRDPADNHKKKGAGEKKKPGKKSQRFAFQTRSQVDILDDGYRWRKYGQKTVKNNTFPRSYYRCTRQGCNVKKQVQRLANDEGIVVTTYEGMHLHPIDRPSENFEQILTQMDIFPPPPPPPQLP
ncbi:hypothetical protein RJ640_028155 [Escallonia rubra]|uniref:WRKY domain-containing protein n=1 Tax=Escallonia rubra TaxID=112253 RepID=A0AA88UB66_9ASTE|nr:hypothetical protein RJ640_028155 [Escallonia rubra]